MKRTNNGPILSALILCTGLLFSCGQQKAKQESLAENEANEMVGNDKDEHDRNNTSQCQNHKQNIKNNIRRLFYLV